MSPLESDASSINIVELIADILKIVSSDQSPSETLNICSVGYVISASSFNSILKNNLFAARVPFARYKSLMFFNKVLLSTPDANLSGIVRIKASLNSVKKVSMVLSTSA